MKIKHSKQRILYEFAIISCCLSILIIAIIFDTFNLPILEILRIKVDAESMHMSLFTIQATISVTGAAIISLLTGVTSKNYYGISVSRFITKVYPFVLKHNTVIVATFIITLVDYFSVALKAFDLSLAIFFCSIALLIYLVKDTFVVFLGEDEMKKRISNAITMSNMDSFASSLFSESISFAEIGQLHKLKDNLSLVKVILFNEETAYKTTSNNTEIEKIESFLLDLMKVLSKRKQPDEIGYLLIYFQSLYDDANQNKVSLNLWWNNPNLFFDSFRYVTIDEYKENHAITKLFQSLIQNEKYDRTFTQDKSKVINNYLIYYYECVYVYLFSLDDSSLLYKNREKIIIDLYKSIFEINYFNETDENDYDWLLLQLTLCNLLKELVDDGNTGKVWKKLFSNYEPLKDGQSILLVHFCIANYLYYLAVSEPLAKDKPAQKRAVELLKEYSSHILTEFDDIDLLEFIKENKHLIFTISDKWEWFPDEHAKAVVYEFSTQNFIVFLTLNVCWDDEAVNKIIDSVFDKSMFSIYDRYFRDESSFDKSYSGFNTLFFGEKRSIDDVKARLFSIVSKDYREEILAEGTKKEITAQDIGEYKNWLLKVCNEAVQEYQELFNTTDTNGETCSNKKTIRLFAINTMAPLSEDHSNRYIRDSIRRNMLSAFLKIIKNNLLTEHIKKNERKVQQTMIDLLTSNTVVPVILIGGNDVFWMEENKNQLREYLDSHGIKTIRDLYCRDEYYFIDPSITAVTICNFRVVVRNLTLEEIMDNCEVDEEGNILYNVTNDLYLPFEKEELVKHLHRTRKIIEIYADIANDSKDTTAGLHFIIE